MPRQMRRSSVLALSTALPISRPLLANLPLQRLERFFGKIKVVSAELRGLDTHSNDRDPYWPDWTVIAKGQRPDGHDVTITMYFEPFKGDLEALYIDAPR